MQKHHSQKGSKDFLWPLIVLGLLTIGVFFTTRQVPNQQQINSHAQDFSGEPTSTPTSTPTPMQGADTTINVAFTLPGMSAASGNTNPIHKTRNITLNFYDTDTNSEDNSTTPLFSFISTATYDTDPQSPTYLHFVGRNINLKSMCASSGKCVPTGEYQIALKTYQSLQKVIKIKDTDFSGKVYQVSDRTTLNLNFGELLVGDIVPLPNGDNLIDGDDINAVINCLGDKFNSPSCPDKVGPDLNDDGVVNETDHDLLTQSIQKLIALGGTVPTSTPTPAPNKKPTVTPKPTAAPASTHNSSSGVFLLGTLGVIILIALIFILTNKNFKNSLNAKKIEKKEYFIKKQSDDKDGNGIWLSLTDDSGTTLGHYAGLEVQEGFGHIRGVTKKVDGKKFIEVTDIMWDDQR